MDKIIRISNKNIQLMEELKQLFAKVKFYQYDDWTDNRIITLALNNLIFDFKERIQKNENNNSE